MKPPARQSENYEKTYEPHEIQKVAHNRSTTPSGLAVNRGQSRSIAVNRGY